MSAEGIPPAIDCDYRNNTQKWFPCNKGGSFRKWFGNNDYVVNWGNDGYEIKHYFKNGKLASRPQNVDCYFKEGLTWSALSSGSFAMRFSPSGYISEHKGTMCFADDETSHMYILASMNSSFASEALSVLCPTLDFGEGAVGNTPMRMDIDSKETVSELAEECVEIAKADWDKFEASWDFRRHPLV